MGNRKAVSAARSALNMLRVKDIVTYTDFKQSINPYTLSTSQSDWNNVVDNNMYTVKPVLGDRESSYSQCWKDDAVFCRVNIGHPHLTHSETLRGNLPQESEQCQCCLTVLHSWWIAITLLEIEHIYLVNKII